MGRKPSKQLNPPRPKRSKWVENHQNSRIRPKPSGKNGSETIKIAEPAPNQAEKMGRKHQNS
jgi:hypothetical protein